MHVGKEGDDWVIEEEDWLDVVYTLCTCTSRRKCLMLPKKKLLLDLFPIAFSLSRARGAHIIFTSEKKAEKR